MPRSAQELPDAIQWHEGMLLTPQHFQQLAARSEELVYYHALSATPFHWGIRHLKIDPVTLVGGVFRILELEAILPDGLIVTHMPGDPDPLEIDLNDNMDALVGKAATINLATPVRRLGGRLSSGELPRFVSVEGPMTTDESTGEGEARIPRLRPRLSLVIEETLPQKFTGFPVAKVELRDEAFTVTAFSPPQLKVSRTSPLGEICQGVARRLREKSTYLAERTSAPAVQTDYANLQHNQLMIHGLVAGLPVLEAMLKTEQIHPFPLYLHLCTVAGHMAAVGGASAPPILGAYDHDDPRQAYEAVSAFVMQMLDRVSELYTAIPFKEEEGVYTLDLQADWLKRPLTLGVRARPGETETDVIDWMAGALIGSVSAIPGMQDRRVLGSARLRLDRDEALDLTPTRGVVLFQVESDPEYIRSGEALTVLANERSGKTNPLEIVLYVKNTTADAVT